MAIEHYEETRVTRGYAASIPATVRRALDIEPGDRIIWRLKDHELKVEVRKAKRSAFGGFEPYDSGHPTDAAF